MKNETKHTPGPWRIGDAGTTIFGHPTNEPAPVIIAINPKPTERVGYHERKANTRLIAAAPELLEACKRAIEAMDEEKQLQASRGESVAVGVGIASSTIRAAIEKAEGK